MPKWMQYDFDILNEDDFRDCRYWLEDDDLQNSEDEIKLRLDDMHHRRSLSLSCCDYYKRVDDWGMSELYKEGNVKRSFLFSPLYDLDGTKLYVYNGTDHVPKHVEHVVVDMAVETIQESAFSNRKSLKRVYLAESLKRIGTKAFAESNLTSIEIPSSVTTLEERAFKLCFRLTSIEIPSSVTTLEKGAFEYCHSLTSIKLPSVTTIGKKAFEHCTSLKSIQMPAVRAIGKSAFTHCESLESIEMPSIEILEECAFFGCRSLLHVAMPSPVISTISMHAFSGCRKLRYVEIPSSVKEIGEHAFEECKSLVSAQLASVDKIGVRAFWYCSSLKVLELPRAEFLDLRFDGCTLLQEAASRTGQDYEEWLKTRFDTLPLHRACYIPEINMSAVSKNLEYANLVDGMGMTALHVLATNANVQVDIVRALLVAYPDAAGIPDNHGFYALHYACYNPRMSHTTFQVLADRMSASSRSLVVAIAPHTGDNLPCLIAIRSLLSPEVQFCLFERNPIKASERRTAKEQQRFSELANEYVDRLGSASATMSPAQKHGWVHFASSFASETLVVEKCIKFLKFAAPIDTVEFLAECKDLHGRRAMDVACKEIREAFEDRLLFLGRYELAKGPPLYNTATSVVVKAYDKKWDAPLEGLMVERRNVEKRGGRVGKKDLRDILEKGGFKFVDDDRFNNLFEGWDQNRDEAVSQYEFDEICRSLLSGGCQGHVVLKFMSDREHYLRETWNRRGLDAEHVVGLLECYEENSVTDFGPARNRVADLKKSYRHMIVMPCGDRNLDTIFRSERPQGERLRLILNEVAESVAHLHRHEMIHGDLKLLNVVRIGRRVRLIDLDAACGVGTSKCSSDSKQLTGPYAGAKFSSGVLPPEMIASLENDEDIEKYTTYFKPEMIASLENDEDLKKHTTYFSTVKEGGGAKWKKLEPLVPAKMDENTRAMVVKTFRSRTQEKTKFGRKYFFQEVDTNSELPYDLVCASTSIDVWSFGVMAYQLHTGETLFEVNRDYDLKDHANMKRLCEWSEDDKQLVILRKFSNDLPAFNFFNRILSRDPKLRHRSMEEVLKDGYLSGNSLAEDMEKVKREIQSVKQDIQQLRKDFIVKIDDMSQSLSLRIERCATVTCRAVFDAKEVSCPTCFIIAEEKLRPDGATDEGIAAKLEKGLSLLEEVLEQTTDLLSQPKQYLLKRAENMLFKQYLYLYLVDECTHKPVVPPTDEVYPIKIRVASDRVKSLIPVLTIGMKAAAVANGAAGIISMFYPCVPGNVIPAKLTEKVKKFVEDVDNGVINDAIEDYERYAVERKRGGALRAFEKFLEEKDPNKTFCDLRMIGDKNGQAMWTSESNAKDLMQRNAEGVYAKDQEIERLRAMLAQLQDKNEKEESAVREKLQKQSGARFDFQI